MKLSYEGLKNKKDWAGYLLPEFNMEKVKTQTKAQPFWIHFGAGNIFRAFQCNLVQRLLNNNILDRGLIAAEGYDYEIVDKMNIPHDNYSILVTLKADGNIEKTVVGSVMESLRAGREYEDDFKRLGEIFRAPSLQMVSFTITEKGYKLYNNSGEILPDVKYDMENGPYKTNSYMGKVVSLLYERYKSGNLPVAMVSMDNCSHNGDRLFEAVNEIVRTWIKNGLADEGFGEYITNNVSFPWTMIDKITPRPDPGVYETLKKDGIEDLEPVITSKKTYVAPFVNAEECEYLVIEDNFPNGRPRLEEGGIIFTDRETVDKVEKMKVCTCLNPLHTALAVFGCLLGYKLISDEMKNPSLKKLVEEIGYTEGLPVVVDPGIINPEQFIDTVINIRIPNPFMPDTPQRIATDTSQKLGIRFGETIKAYMQNDELKTSSLKFIPLVLAGWIRYLMGIDDNGRKFDLSPDPILEKAARIMNNINLGDKAESKNFDELYTNVSIFGVNLYEAELADKVTEYFNELNKGVGAVQATLNKYTL